MGLVMWFVTVELLKLNIIYFPKIRLVPYSAV